MFILSCNSSFLCLLLSFNNTLFQNPTYCPPLLLQTLSLLSNSGRLVLLSSILCPTLKSIFPEKRSYKTWTQFYLFQTLSYFCRQTHQILLIFGPSAVQASSNHKSLNMLAWWLKHSDVCSLRELACDWFLVKPKKVSLKELGLSNNFHRHVLN